MKYTILLAVAAVCSGCSDVNVQPKDVTKLVNGLCGEYALLEAQGVKFPEKVELYVDLLCHPKDSPDGG